MIAAFGIEAPKLKKTVSESVLAKFVNRWLEKQQALVETNNFRHNGLYNFFVKGGADQDEMMFIKPELLRDAFEDKMNPEIEDSELFDELQAHLAKVTFRYTNKNLTEDPIETTSGYTSISEVTPRVDEVKRR